MLRKLLSFLSERVLKASQHSIPCAVARCARLSREPAEQYLFGNMLVAWVHESFEPVFLGVMPLLQIRMWPFQVITDWKSHEFPSTSPQLKHHKTSHGCLKNATPCSPGAVPCKWDSTPETSETIQQGSEVSKPKHAGKNPVSKRCPGVSFSTAGSSHTQPL